MLSKESKIRVLENFYALDYVFFGKPVSEVEFCCPLVKEEYISIKGALMSVFVEMLKLVDHTPKSISEQVDGKRLKTFARRAAKIARENSEKIVSSPKARANIKSMLKEELTKDPKLDISNLVEKTIRNKAFSLAVDNLMIARSLSEASEYKKLDEWEGQIIEDSYKILRDNLVESAYMILYDNEETEDLSEAAIQYSASQIISMARKHGKGVEKQARAGCEKWSIKAPFKSQEYKNKMMACKAQAAIKGLQASAAYAKKLSSHCKEQGVGNICKKKIYGFLVDLKSEIADNKRYIK